MSKARELAELGAAYDSGALSNRNLVINGAMNVSQRATSATAAVAGGSYITLDRYKIYNDTDGAYTSEQSTTAPDGFPNSMKLQVTTADTSLSSAQYAAFAHFIEAQNLQQLAYGANTAKDVTVSFYVRSNKTGTYCFCLNKNDSTQYLFIKEFTIDVADTWERKIITVSPDSQIKASGGAIANDNGAGLRAFIFLAAGSDYHGTNNVWNTNTNYYATSNQVNWMDSTSNNFYITGLQIEVGTEATPFEHRSFDDELLRCSRYFQTISGGSDAFTFSSKAQGASSVDATVTLRTPLRASPTFNSINSRYFNDGSYVASSSTTPTVSQFSANNGMVVLNCGGFSGLTNNEAGNWGPVSNELTIDAEL